VLESDVELRKGQHLGLRLVVLDTVAEVATAETREDGTMMTETSNKGLRMITMMMIVMIAETINNRMATMTIMIDRIIDRMIDRIVIEAEAEVHQEGATAEDSKEGAEALAPAARRGKDPA
jgi:hypothetical protein